MDFPRVSRSIYQMPLFITVCVCPRDEKPKKETRCDFEILRVCDSGSSSLCMWMRVNWKCLNKYMGDIAHITDTRESMSNHCEKCEKMVEDEKIVQRGNTQIFRFDGISLKAEAISRWFYHSNFGVACAFFESEQQIHHLFRLIAFPGNYHTM